MKPDKKQVKTPTCRGCCYHTKPDKVGITCTKKADGNKCYDEIHDGPWYIFVKPQKTKQHGKDGF